MLDQLRRVANGRFWKWLLTAVVCCSPVKSVTAAYPGKIIMKMGMFPRIPKPEAQGFGMHRQSWEGKHDGIPVFEFKWAGPEKKQMAE